MRFVPIVALTSTVLIAASPALGMTSRLTRGDLAPGKSASVSVATPARGEFSFRLNVSSDGEKKLRLTQQRKGGSAFTVMTLPGAPKGACQGAAGSVICANIQTPAPVKGTYVFRFTNKSSRPMSVTLQVTFTKVNGQ